MEIYKSNHKHAVRRTLTVEGELATVRITNRRGTLTAYFDTDSLKVFSWQQLQVIGKKTHPYLGVNCGGSMIPVHRLICIAPDGHDVDHINLDPLDCRTSNLRALPVKVNRGSRRTLGREAA